MGVRSLKRGKGDEKRNGEKGSHLSKEEQGTRVGKKPFVFDQWAEP